MTLTLAPALQADRHPARSGLAERLACLVVLACWWVGSGCPRPGVVTAYLYRADDRVSVVQQYVAGGAEHQPPHVRVVKRCRHRGRHLP